MSHRILVTGASGHIGKELVRLLQQRGADFAALTSRSGSSLPGVLTVEGNFADPVSLERAFRGFDTLFLLLPLVPQKLELARNAIRAAKAAGVQYIVRSSGAGADPDAPVAIGKLQGQIDQEVKESGLSWTILMPNFFMQNWQYFSADQLKSGTYRAPEGNGAKSVIDVRDVAEAAAAVLANPAAHAGRSYTLTGPEALTSAQQLAAISEVAGRTISYLDVPEEAARQAMQGMGITSPMLDWLLSLSHVVKQGWGAGVTRDFTTLTGREPRRFADFVKDQAAAWR